jgi:hypothetical protein
MALLQHTTPSLEELLSMATAAPTTEAYNLQLISIMKAHQPKRSLSTQVALAVVWALALGVWALVGLLIVNGQAMWVHFTH